MLVTQIIFQSLEITIEHFLSIFELLWICNQVCKSSIWPQFIQISFPKIFELNQKFIEIWKKLPTWKVVQIGFTTLMQILGFLIHFYLIELISQSQKQTWTSQIFNSKSILNLKKFLWRKLFLYSNPSNPYSVSKFWSQEGPFWIGQIWKNLKLFELFKFWIGFKHVWLRVATVQWDPHVSPLSPLSRALHVIAPPAPTACGLTPPAVTDRGPPPLGTSRSGIPPHSPPPASKGDFCTVAALFLHRALSPSIRVVRPSTEPLPCLLSDTTIGASPAPMESRLLPLTYSGELHFFLNFSTLFPPRFTHPVLPVLQVLASNASFYRSPQRRRSTTVRRPTDASPPRRHLSESHRRLPCSAPPPLAVGAPPPRLSGLTTTGDHATVDVPPALYGSRIGPPWSASWVLLARWAWQAVTAARPKPWAGIEHLLFMPFSISKKSIFV
jgi:hypothetical protein